MRILVATDQPFWTPDGGAKQRIACLVGSLLSDGQAGKPAIGGVFYLGPVEHLSAQGKALASDFGEVFSPLMDAAADKRSPSGATGQSMLRTANNVLKDWAGTASKWTLGKKSKGAQVGAAGSSTVPNQGNALRLSDYRWDWVLPYFNHCVQQFRPDVVLLEYATMTYLMDAIDPGDRSRIVWAVDTHDCLSHRCRQFQELGQTHWLEISEAEELQALSGADIIVAIQDQEAAWFGQRLPRQQVVVAGHSPGIVPGNLQSHGPVVPVAPIVAAVSTESISDPVVRFGFIGSDNFPNQQAISTFLDQVWSTLDHPGLRLVVAGSICNFVRKYLAEHDSERSVDVQQLVMMDRVDALESFYGAVDVVLSPIQVGTGLKIKTVEALAMGKPVLASPHAAGDFATQVCGLKCCQTSEDWRQEILRMARDANSIEAARQQASHFANASLRPETVYRELRQAIQETIDQKRNHANG